LNNAHKRGFVAFKTGNLWRGFAEVLKEHQSL